MSADKDGYLWSQSTDSQCVEWTGAVTSTGYGIVHVGSTTTTAHRAAWVAAHGPIPDDWQVDHLCRNPRCVSLDHLEAVTASENVRRKLAAGPDRWRCEPTGTEWEGDLNDHHRDELYCPGPHMRLQREMP
jgi:hypothetical protein